MVRVTESVLGLLKEIEAKLMSCPEVNVILGGAEVLNSKPAGVLRIIMTPEPEAKSNLFPSRIMIGPSVVQAGEDALAALSASMFVPPVAAVIVAVPKALCTSRNTVANASR